MFDKSSDLFPIKERYVFLAHCGIAPLYAPALKKEHEVGDEQSRTGALVFRRYDAILDSLRDASAQLLRTDPDNLAFVKNTSEGMNMIAGGYPFQAGDQVISYVHEYPANHYPWKRQERRGVELVLLPDRDITAQAPPGLPVAWTMRDLAERITPRTRIVALSHVQFASGFAADLQALAEFCGTHGIDLVIDAAQSLGSLPIYPEAWGIAAVVSSGWKWLMGPIGTGLMYTSEKFRGKLDLALVGAESMRQGTDYLNHAWDPYPSSKCFEYSTSPIALAAALDCCVRELPLRYGVETIAREIARLQAVFLAALDHARSRPIFADQRSSILSLVAPNADAVRRALLKENVICTERGGYLRIAPHFYNTDADMERAASLINMLCARSSQAD